MGESGAMKRRTFLKTLVGVVASASPLTRLLGADEAVPRPFVKSIPTTPFEAPEGTWTLAVLPDTQFYSRGFPETFVRQTEWIVAHQKIHRIQFVAHEGDLVNNPTQTEQWQNAQKAMKVLSDGGIPFSILPGNHDLGTQEEGSTNDRTTLLNTYFHETDYKNSAAYGLFESGKMENSWHEFTAPTGKYLVVALEFGPRDEVLDWANHVVAGKADHKVIVVTHAYLNASSKRDDWTIDKPAKSFGNPKAYPLAKVGSVNDGQDVWSKFTSKHPGIFLVMNGHVCDSGTGYLKSSAEDGHSVHQILANYQDNSPKAAGTVVPPRGYGGGGYLRLLQFQPNGKSVQVKTYSPWYDEWLKEPNQEFSFTV